MKDAGGLSVSDFLVSPRHAHHFLNSIDEKNKIKKRFEQLCKDGRIESKIPIINIQESDNIVELHDGNATTVAWWIYAEKRKIPKVLSEFRKSFNTIILLNRVHENGEIWHPYVPLDVACAGKLQTVIDSEHGMQTCKAITIMNEPVYFNNIEFFSGRDEAVTIEEVAMKFYRKYFSDFSNC